MQIQSNALAALEALDPQVAEEVLAAGCITGDRINGLCDGETGKWWVLYSSSWSSMMHGSWNCFFGSIWMLATDKLHDTVGGFL